VVAFGGEDLIFFCRDGSEVDFFEIEQLLSDEECERFGENARDERGSIVYNKAEKILSNESPDLIGNSLKLIDDGDGEIFLELKLFTSVIFGTFGDKTENPIEDLL